VDYDAAITRAARSANVHPELVRAFIVVESASIPARFRAAVPSD